MLSCECLLLCVFDGCLCGAVSEASLEYSRMFNITQRSLTHAHVCVCTQLVQNNR